MDFLTANIYFKLYPIDNLICNFKFNNFLRLERPYRSDNVLGEYSKQNITYIFGFGVKRLFKKLKCDECLKALFCKNRTFDHNSIFVIDMSNLIYPLLEKQIKYELINENKGKITKRNYGC